MGLSAAEAAEILGVRPSSVDTAVHRGRLPKPRKHAKRGLELEDVECLSLDLLKRGEPHPYWATTAEASELLGVTTRRVRQLVGKGFLPAVEHKGRYYFRRQQLDVVANAREARDWADWK